MFDVKSEVPILTLRRLVRYGTILVLVAVGAFSVRPASAWRANFIRAFFTNYQVSGTVTDNNGAALTDVTITVSGSASTFTTTGPTGFYSFLGGLDGSGSYTLTPSRGGYSFQPATRNISNFTSDQINQNFVGTPLVTYSISGTILDNQGQPLSDVAVHLEGSAKLNTLTAPNGTYTFSGLAAGFYIITPQRGGYGFSPQNRQVTLAGNTTGQDFTGTPVVTYTISGTILDNLGTPMVDVALHLSGSATIDTLTGPSGTYSFTGLAAGAYMVTPTKGGYSFNPTSRSYPNFISDQTAQDYTGTPVVTYTSSGTVTDGANPI
jgi:inhibitor of cysteine peptidase